ncbi:MAG: Crp/Fnr family transcriptional regulator [Bacteroidetes bacterium]|nr:Crp/Fnr family transcriptional regulator [Bacteroidota bacterium]
MQPEIQLLDTGSYVHSVPLVLKGSIRVSRRDEDKELLLYYVQPGEVCIMSFNACCNNSASMIIATTIEPTTILLLPSSDLRKWLQEYPSLNTFIYAQFNNRYLDLIDTINQLIFSKLDERLLSYLESKNQLLNGEEIPVTHQQIAYDLGTAREVISRLMKKLEKEGKIIQGRNHIKYLSV